MRMISGFEQPTAGTVRIAGQDMSGVKPYKRPTNLVFQHLSLFPHLSVAKNISFGLEMSGESKTSISTKVGNMLDLVHLTEFGNRKISQLSGGQKQRVAIARALVNQPTVLLLDEPLGALDLKLREQMQLELKRIQREVGTTFIYVTHDQKEAITMSNKIAVVNNGRIEQLDSSATIYERPKTSFVAGFIGETNLIEGTLESLEEKIGVIRVKGTQIRAIINFDTVLGDTITLSIRPEHLQINAKIKEGMNHLSATIDDEIYLGSLSHYRAILDDESVVAVEVQNRSDRRRHERGTKVQLAWMPDDAITFLKD